MALGKLKTVTVQTPLKGSIHTRRMTLKTECSETYSMDKGVCALDDSGQLKVIKCWEYGGDSGMLDAILDSLVR